MEQTHECQVCNTAKPTVNYWHFNDAGVPETVDVCTDCIGVCCCCGDETISSIEYECNECENPVCAACAVNVLCMPTEQMRHCPICVAPIVQMRAARNKN